MKADNKMRKQKKRTPLRRFLRGVRWAVLLCLVFNVIAAYAPFVNLPDLDAAELETRAILHAPAGMVVARDEYGVRDPRILSAIRKHTVGDGHMSPMDALIYVSDFIEPGREPFPGLEKARGLAEKDIFEAMCCCAELTEKHLRSRGQSIHPRTLQLLETYS